MVYKRFNQFVGFATGLIIILTFTLVLINADEVFTEQMNNTYYLCCDGYACSDTYYDVEKGLCVLTLTDTVYTAGCGLTNNCNKSNNKLREDE